MKQIINIDGPYRKYYSPLGKVIGYHDEWFVSKELSDKEQETDIQKNI